MSRRVITYHLGSEKTAARVRSWSGRQRAAASVALTGAAVLTAWLGLSLHSAAGRRFAASAGARADAARQRCENAALALRLDAAPSDRRAYVMANLAALSAQHAPRAEIEAYLVNVERLPAEPATCAAKPFHVLGLVRTAEFGAGLDSLQLSRRESLMARLDRSLAEAATADSRASHAESRLVMLADALGYALVLGAALECLAALRALGRASTRGPTRSAVRPAGITR